MRPRWPRPMGAIRSITGGSSRPAPRKLERLVRVDRDEVLEMGKAPVLLRWRPPAFCTSTSVRRPPPPSRASLRSPFRRGPRSPALRMRAPRRRRESVGSSGQPASETPDAFSQLHDAGDRYRRSRSRDRCLSGVPRPSRPLILRLGSTGPVVSVGVSMAPRMPRAVPHRRPVRSRRTIIVSSAQGL
jgi:hypothetical protein